VCRASAGMPMCCASASIVPGARRDRRRRARGMRPHPCIDPHWDQERCVSGAFARAPSRARWARQGSPCSMEARASEAIEPRHWRACGVGPLGATERLERPSARDRPTDHHTLACTSARQGDVHVGSQCFAREASEAFSRCGRLAGAGRDVHIIGAAGSCSGAAAAPAHASPSCVHLVRARRGSPRRMAMRKKAGCVRQARACGPECAGEALIAIDS